MAARRARKGGQRVSLERKRWAMIAYIAGDNDLSDFGLEDIAEMCETGASPHVHAAVQIDTIGAHTGSIRYEITEPDPTGKSHRTVIERLPESDTGDPRILQDFLRWGTRRYPARNTLAVVWNHGSGFRKPQRNIAYDDYGTSLDLPEITLAMRGAGITGGNRLAILGFDACLMNMIEIVDHLRDHAELVVGSQQVEPGDGWPYDRILAAMKTNPTPRALAAAIVKTYIRSYAEIGEDNVTQSAVVTDAVPAAIKSLSNLGQALARTIGAHRPTLSLIRAQVQSYEYADYVDMVHFGRLVATRIPASSIRLLGKAVARHAKAAVIANKSRGAAVADSNGISMWFPADRATYLSFRAKYLALNFARDHRGWVEFLDAYHG